MANGSAAGSEQFIERIPIPATAVTFLSLLLDDMLGSGPINLV
jgi:hypothetical protein